MKILVVGETRHKIYAYALFKALEKLECCDVSLFDITERINRCKLELIRRVQVKYAVGPIVSKLNKQLYKAVEEICPDLIFFYTTRYFDKQTLHNIKEKGIIIFAYNNDNPFSEYFAKYYWRKYLLVTQVADVVYAYRESNIRDYMSIGCKKIKLLHSYYIKSHNFYIENLMYNKAISPEVVFLGHYENDARVSMIKALLDNNIKVGLPKKSWEHYLKHPNIELLDNTTENYNLILNNAKIAMVFLSTTNKDTYTRRLFEIPATKTLMISQYTDKIAEMYEENDEIVFFRDETDLVKKVKYYLENQEEARIIAEKAYTRLMRDGNEVEDRAKQIVNDYYNIIDLND